MSRIKTKVINIPEELKRENQWVCYDQNKKPISAITGSSVDWQNNLSSFEVAAAYAEKHGLGIGFCFTNQTEFFGIDLDGCLDPKTGVIEPWALAILELVEGYKEVSMSWTGLKIIARGHSTESLPRLQFGEVKHGHHKQQCEFRTASGYFALTGLLHAGLRRDTK